MFGWCVYLLHWNVLCMFALLNLTIRCDKLTGGIHWKTCPNLQIAKGTCSHVISRELHHFFEFKLVNSRLSREGGNEIMWKLMTINLVPTFEDISLVCLSVWMTTCVFTGRSPLLDMCCCPFHIRPTIRPSSTMTTGIYFLSKSSSTIWWRPICEEEWWRVSGLVSSST